MLATGEPQLLPQRYQIVAKRGRPVAEFTPTKLEVREQYVECMHVKFGLFLSLRCYQCCCCWSFKVLVNKALAMAGAKEIKLNISQLSQLS